MYPWETIEDDWTTRVPRGRYPRRPTDTGLGPLLGRVIEWHRATRPLDTTSQM